MERNENENDIVVVEENNAEKRQLKSCLTIRQRRTLIWLTMGVNVALVIASFILPPMGQIDSSVLTAVGEIGGFATVFVGIETNGGVLPLFTKKK